MAARQPDWLRSASSGCPRPPAAKSLANRGANTTSDSSPIIGSNVQPECVTDTLPNVGTIVSTNAHSKFCANTLTDFGTHFISNYFSKCAAYDATDSCTIVFANPPSDSFADSGADTCTDTGAYTVAYSDPNPYAVGASLDAAGLASRALWCTLKPLLYLFSGLKWHMVS